MMSIPVAKAEFVTYDNARNLAKELKRRREEIGETQVEVAARTGLTQQDVSTSERLGPLTGMRLYNFLVLLRYYHMEPNEAARILGLFGD